MRPNVLIITVIIEEHCVCLVGKIKQNRIKECVHALERTWVPDKREKRDSPGRWSSRESRGPNHNRASHFSGHRNWWTMLHAPAFHSPQQVASLLDGPASRQRPYPATSAYLHNLGTPCASWELTDRALKQAGKFCHRAFQTGWETI